VPDQTLEVRGTKRVKIATTGHEKDSMTVWFSSVATCCEGVWSIGYLPPHLIWKAKSDTGPIAKEVRDAAKKHGCTADVSTNGWSTGVVFYRWLKTELVNLHPGKRRLLIMDLYSSHRTPEVLELLKGEGIDVVFIPGGCTGVLQLMDVALNKKVKKEYCEKWCAWRAKNTTCPTREDVTRWLMEVLHLLPPGENLGAWFQKVVLNYIMDPEDAPLYMYGMFLKAAKAHMESIPVAHVDDDGDKNAAAQDVLDRSDKWMCEVCASENEVDKRRQKKKDRQVCTTCEHVGPWL